MSDVRDRVMEGALTCIGRYGMAKTTVDDVARASGVSRATIYRHFPGGRDQVVADVVAWEVGRFFQRMGEAVAAMPDLASLVSEALRFAHRAAAEHEVLQRVLATEPQRLLPILTVSSDRILPLVAGFLVPYMERERAAGRLRPGVEVERAADFLARMLLSWIRAPGAWDLEDAEQRAALVRGQLLAGILQPSASAAGPTASGGRRSR
ncbi:MAG: TetR/AcrR family transcriptional regulator [Acidimicrobiia bacterium]